MFPKMLEKGHYSRAFFPMYFIFVNTVQYVLVTPIEEKIQTKSHITFQTSKD